MLNQPSGGATSKVPHLTNLNISLLQPEVDVSKVLHTNERLKQLEIKLQKQQDFELDECKYTNPHPILGKKDLKEKVKGLKKKRAAYQSVNQSFL